VLLQLLAFLGREVLYFLVGVHSHCASHGQLSPSIRIRG